MILQALIEYAERENLGDPDFDKVNVHWAVRFKYNGQFDDNIISLSEKIHDEKGKGKPKIKPRELMRPHSRSDDVGHGKAYFLCDTLERALLMLDPKEPQKHSGRKEQHNYFKQLIKEAASHCPNEKTSLEALYKALNDPQQLEKIHQKLEEQKAKTSDNVTFYIEKFPPLMEHEEIKTYWRQRLQKERAEQKTEERMCLATGKVAPILEVTGKIKGIPDGLATGTNLISFDKPSFTSYDFKKAHNAPISFDAEQKFRAAIETLIEKGKRDSDVVHIFWTKKPCEENLLDIIDQANEEDVRKLLNVPYIGHKGHVDNIEDPNAFYAMSLSGNGGRIIVRDWLESTVTEVKAKLTKWFKQLKIITPDGIAERLDFKLFWLCKAMTHENTKEEKIAGLKTQLLYTALRGTSIPIAILDVALQRQQVDSNRLNNNARMALIKLYLLRSQQSSPTSNIMEKDIKPGLNPENKNPAYLCGRLLDILDRLQYVALGKVNAGVVDRYYASFSTTPSMVSGSLLANANNHLHKLKSDGKGGAYENIHKEIESITDFLGQEFPKILSLEDQGRFALGYYQQHAESRRIAAAKKEEKENNENNK